jgi:hypothetical protein
MRVSGGEWTQRDPHNAGRVFFYREVLGCFLLNLARCPAQLPLISLDAAEDGKFSIRVRFPTCDDS